MSRKLMLLLAASVALTACKREAEAPAPAPEAATPPAAAHTFTADITEGDFADMVNALASDEFEGRAPATRGEERTVAYVVEELKKAGVQSGGERGTWTQDVPLVRAQVEGAVTASLRIGGETQVLANGEDVVLQSELDRAVQNVLAQYANQPNQLPPRAVLERQVLERLVLVKLQVARATESGIRIGDAELNNAINAVAQQNGTTPDGLRQRLEADGMSFPEFRNSLRDEITIQRLKQSFAQSRINVSEGEVDAALAAQAASGTQYRLAHILVGLPDGEAFEFTTLGQAVQSIWYTTTGSWFERQADLRSQLVLNQGQPGDKGNLLGIQPELFAADYQSPERGAPSYARLTVVLWRACHEYHDP